MTGTVRLRHPDESDHRAIVELVDEWWGGRRMRALLPRLWFQHFSGTSWLAESADGRLLGFLIGFISPDQPDQGYVHMIATNPNVRRRGIGRRLYQRFIDDVARQGVRQVRAITWPGNRVSVDFHRRLGFRPDEGPGSAKIYGVPAFPDYDGDGEDRTVFIREV